jgi:hypothetical protein
MARVADLGKRVVADYQKLFRLEAQLLREAAKPQLQRAGMSAGFAVTALLLAHLAIIFLLLTAAAALALVLPVWASLLIVAGVLILAVAVLLAAARRGFKAANPLIPPQATERMKQDLQWVREQSS